MLRVWLQSPVLCRRQAPSLSWCEGVEVRPFDSGRRAVPCSVVAAYPCRRVAGSSPSYNPTRETPCGRSRSRRLWPEYGHWAARPLDEAPADEVLEGTNLTHCSRREAVHCIPHILSDSSPFWSFVQHLRWRSVNAAGLMARIMVKDPWLTHRLPRTYVRPWPALRT